MKIFISGGCKNGKSYFAQSLAKQLAEESGGPLYYIATMIPCDEEDRARIRRHIEDRAGWGFETIEQGRNIKEIFDKAYENGIIYRLVTTNLTYQDAELLAKPYYINCDNTLRAELLT